MINIYKDSDIEPMKKSCQLARDVLICIEPYIKEGITTDELNLLCHKFIIDSKAVPACLGYKGFPKSVCTSVNNVVCHGIPDCYKLKSGDIINIDVTVILDGWFGDTSKTFTVGNCSKLSEKLVKVTENALDIGIKAVKPYGYFGDIGYAIQKYVEKEGFSVVRDFCGHGIGKSFHEAPHVLHYGTMGTMEQILPGMFFTIEPMVNVGSYKVEILDDGWTTITIDDSLSAQFEHTLAVTDDDVIVLTK